MLFIAFLRVPSKVLCIYPPTFINTVQNCQLKLGVVIAGC
ncbi:hypothetical protein T10_2666 [Trichinella papuae]|uniref:Uncharacterized protein n=1 Tax=Trichinella papuae TaxID=268474 RepID=A0A0V1LZH7_9BILA|nr:hypothetical protein T10_2666 [Trichinella papuae]